MFTANQIANFFLSKIDNDKGDTISPLKLQKLIYYAQAWHYTIFGEPLFDERIEAWRNGPVVPSIYARFAGTMRHNSINLEGQKFQEANFNEDTLALLNEVRELYGERSGSYLEELTHNESPWLEARGNCLPHEACTNEITLESMRNYYSKFLNEQKG